MIFSILNHRLANLDLLRGLAALLVCAGHLRAFLMLDFGQVKSPTILDRIFYVTTGLGHQAVMVFFVLSGFLVGGSVLTAYQSGRWSWMNYTLRRMSRLWMVLLPALVLTLILDNLGRHWFPLGYAGKFQVLYNSGPTLAAPADLRPTTFLGNAFFLQTIEVPRLGTNGPLWSLANEFWYYALFPLVCGIWFMRSLIARFVFALSVAGLIWWLPAGITWSGIIWLLGRGILGGPQRAGSQDLQSSGVAHFRWRSILWFLGSQQNQFDFRHGLEHRRGLCLVGCWFSLL